MDHTAKPVGIWLSGWVFSLEGILGTGHPEIDRVNKINMALAPQIYTSAILAISPHQGTRLRATH